LRTVSSEGEVPITKPESYYAVYAAAFEPLRNNDVHLLEIGVADGDSVQRWLDWFPNGEIAGLDLNPPNLELDRLRLYRGSQDDTVLLDRIAGECAPGGFDIIIDDASHVGWLTAASFWHLFPNHLKPGGIYVIEDWATGYWPHWHGDGRKFVGAIPPTAIARRAAWPFRDIDARLRWTALLRNRFQLYWPLPAARSHGAGMVGVIKQIVDAVAIPDILRGDPNAAVTDPGVSSIELQSGQVIVRKSRP